MPIPGFLVRPLARLSLLIAAVLQICGTAVGPLAHLPALQDRVEGTVLHAPEGVPAEPVGLHDELTCAFCHSVLGAALLPSGSVAPPADEASRRAGRPLPTVPTPASRQGPYQSRAPPILV